MNRKKMNERILFVFAVLMSVSFMSCQEKKDLVDDFEPREQHSENFYGLLDAIENAPNLEESQRLMETLKDRVARQAVLFAKRHSDIPKTASVDSVVFYHGSARKAKANDGTGDVNVGKFRNRLIAYIYTSGQQEPLKVLVSCMNGLFRIYQGGEFNRLVGVGSSKMQFTIGKGEGLLHHISSYRSAVMVANSFDLPLYRGKYQVDKNLITSDEAMSLESSTDIVQVTVKVFVGDKFDLNNMTLTKSNGRVISAGQ